MILLIETEIFSDVLIDEVLVMKHLSFTIKLHPNSSQTLSKISIEKCVSDFKGFIPKVEVDNQRNLKIEFPKEDFLFEQMQILQHIESFGALDLGIKEINWQNPIIKWIPENDEERLSLPIPEYRRNLRYEQAVKKATLGWLQNSVLFREQLSHLVLPLSFYRKGMNLYSRFEYSEAYLNFYLMLEGLFSNGKTKNNAVKEQFLKSETLRYATTQAINSLAKENCEQHKIWLETYLKNKKNNERRGFQKWVRLSFIANGLVTPLITIVYFYPIYSYKLLVLGFPWAITAPLFMLLLAIMFKTNDRKDNIIIISTKQPVKNVTDRPTLVKDLIS